ncbi:MAG: flippase [bacterium]|nr:flippase [bacterium]
MAAKKTGAQPAKKSAKSGPAKQAGSGDNRFLRDIVQVFGGNVAMMIIGVGTGAITARALGPHDRGLFQLLVLLPVTLGNFAKLGIPQASVYFMRRRGASASQVASNAFWAALVMGTLMAIACWFGRDWIQERLLKDAPRDVLLPILMLIPAILLQTYFLGIAQAQQRFHEYNIQQVVPNLLALVGMFVVLLVLDLGLIGAVLTHVAINLFMTVWLALRIHRVAPLRWRVDTTLARDMLGFGGKSYVQTLAATQHQKIDQYLIGYLLTPDQVGLYAIAVNMTNILTRIWEATGTVLFPRLAASDDRTAHAATARVARHTVFITVVGALGLLVAGPIVIPLIYGRDFAGAVPALLWLLPSLVMMALYQILTRNFTSRGKQEINIIAAVLALVLNVGCNLWLIPRYGIVGAAIANNISYSVAAILLLVAFVRESGHGLAEATVLRGNEVRAMLQRIQRLGLQLVGRAGA